MLSINLISNLKSMHSRELNVNGVKWIDGVNLSKQEIIDLLSPYNFHELDVEACLEDNQKSRLDKYDDYIFMVMHFPKYNSKTKRHEMKEFNVFMWKDFLITLRSFRTHHINDIFDKYEKGRQDKDDNFKLTTAYILYEILQAMFEKMFKALNNINRDLIKIEEIVFVQAGEALVKDIMIMKRNVIVLKHSFKPQTTVIRLLELNVKKIFHDEIEVYFEDLEDKIDYIVNDLMILEENISSVEESYKSIVEMKTNFIIKVLTLFSSFFLPLTLIASFYWMNVDLPFSSHPSVVYILMFVSVATMLITYLYLKKNNKF